MDKRHRLLLIPAFILFISPLIAQAAAPTQVTYSGNHLQIPFYGWGDSGNCKSDCLGTTTAWTGGYHDASSYSQYWANYTNFALGAASNAAQSFAVGIKGTGNLSAIQSDHVEINNCSTSCVVHFQYFMPSGSSYAFPPNVLETFGSSVTNIGSAGYFTSASSFSFCAAPCVYVNTSNKTLVMKGQANTPVTFDVYLVPNNNNQVSTSTNYTVQGGGGGGGGGIFTSTTSILGVTVPVPDYTALGILLILGMIGGLVSLGILRQEPSFRRAEHKTAAEFRRATVGGSHAVRQPSKGRVRFRRRKGLGRETVIGRLLSAVIVSALILYVIPNLKPSLFNLVIIIVAAAVVSDCVALYLAGKRTWHILIPAVIVIFLVAALFIIAPLGY